MYDKSEVGWIISALPTWSVDMVIWWNHITVDNTDPNNPVINYDWEVVFNVKDFWAIWDWIDNDTTAFQDAVNATWANWWEKMRVHSSWNISIWDAWDANKLKITWSVWDLTSLIYLSTPWTWKTALKFDTWFTSASAPVWASTYINVDIWWVVYRILAQAVA